MTRAADPAAAGVRTQEDAWSRRDTALLALAATTLALLAAQFALAGFGAFTMAKAPADNAYGAHLVLGVVIGAACWLILIAALSSRPARNRRTLRLAVTLAVLAIPVEPLLGEAGQRVPAVGALHALCGLALFALTAGLLVETGRRGAAARRDRS
jgi:uncharacterized membrane protein YidH (DUF202 family)